MTRSRTHRHRLRPRLVAAVAAALAVVVGGPSATAAPPTTQDLPAAAPSAAATDGLRALSLPGLRNSTYRITLITGDEVTLIRTAGRYTVTTKPALRVDGTMPEINVDVKTGPDGATTSMYALPGDAAAVVAAGAVDRNAFDLLWLAARIEAGEAATLPVTVSYGNGLDAAALKQRASALSGATIAATNPTAGTVDLRVDPAQAAGFWADFKGRSSVGEVTEHLLNGVTPKLAGDAVALWPTGHRSPTTKPQGDTGQPLYKVTWTVKRQNGEPTYCGTLLATLCLTGLPAIAQVAGSAVGSGYEPVSASCLDSDPCTTYEFTFQVPAGTYHAGGHGRFWLRSRTQSLRLDVPEFAVTGDTTIALDGDTAQQLTVSTPRPHEEFLANQAIFRTYSDGRGGAELVFPAPGYGSVWALPSAPVTAGTFHLTQNLVLGKPRVTMAVTRPTRIELDPMMPAHYYNPAWDVARFTGRQTVSLVDGGLGREADFARIDARGKLVLLQIDAGELGVQCDVKTGTLTRALAAGAVGVLIDPVSTGGPWPTLTCRLPIWPSWWQDGQDAPDIPYAAITPAEVDKLRRLLDQGTVKIDVSGYDSVSPYVYNLHLYHEGRIPASLHTTVTDKQLAVVDTSLHGTQPRPATWIYSAFRANETVAGGASYYDMGGGTGGVRYTTYQGPVAPDLVRLQFYEPTAPHVGGTTIDVVDRAGPSTAPWTARPLVPGAPALPPEVFRAQPGKWDGADWFSARAACSYCRQGDTFYPVTHLVSGANPSQIMGAYVFLPENVHLYADGQELPQSVSPLWGPTYDLPPEARRYRLTADTASTSTAWSFTSSVPTQDNRPQGFYCVEGSGVPCHAEPLVFLRYDVGGDLNDAVTAPGKHQIKVSAYHHAPGAPPITSLSLSISTDGGVTWQELKVASSGGGDYTATYRVPNLADTSGTVSIRARAEDAAGNTVEQTVRDAFQLTGGR